MDEASKILVEVLDNSSNIVVEIRNEVFKLLGINTQNQKLTEYVKECLEKFSFNVVEKQFLAQIENVVTEEISKSDAKLKNNESVDYELFTSNMIERLKQVKLGNLYLDDDLKALSDEIVDRFPQTNISRDQFYSHFSSKKEQIVNMINTHNKNIVETLIKFTPQLSSELSNKDKSNQNVVQTPTQAQSIDSNGLSIDQFLSRCTQKLDEVNIMFKNGGNSKSEIAKGFRQLKGFVESLNDKSFAQSVLDRYIKLNAVAQGVIYDNIIFENVPMLREIYDKYDSLLVASQVAELKNNLGQIFDTPVSSQAQRPVNTGGTIPREPAIDDVLGADNPRDFNMRQLREMQEEQARTTIHTDEERQQISEQLQQAQVDIGKTLEWAKQQPNVPQFASVRSDEKTDEIPEWAKDTGVSGYSLPTVEQITAELNSTVQQPQAPSFSEQPSVNQEKQLKDNLVQQIMSAMNKSGEMAFGDISFDERMYRMNEIKDRLSRKSVEDLQTLLSTYQEQSFNMEEQHTSSIRR